MKKKKIFIIGIVALIGLGIAFGGNDSSGGKTTASTSQSEQQKKGPSKEETVYSKFIDLPMGASYEEVKAALGEDGKLMHQSQIGGITSESYNFQIGSAHMTFMFQNGQMVSRAMSDLRFLRSNDKVTLAMFNQIKPGMNYDQVREITGSDDRLLSQTSIMGMTSTMLSWMNTGGSNMILTFGSDGTVDSKSQFGLK